jgi:pimeloyl-ACP methyl ester carboxylesterase
MLLKAFILTVSLMTISGCDLQNRLLYYPGSSAPSDESLKADNLKRWKSSSGDYRGVVAAKEMGGTRGTIVVFHGNGGIAADRSYYLKDLGALGYRVILSEYPGYGGRKGELGEKSFVRDAVETVRLASEEYGGPLFLLGESLGCGVAAAVAKVTTVRIDGIVLITPWDTLASIAREKFPFLPVRLFLTDKYDNIANLAFFKGRIAVVGAERDEIIPLPHAKKLYD